MKKMFITISIIVSVIVLLTVGIVKLKPNGSTKESREKLLNKDSEVVWLISKEMELGNYIISGIYMGNYSGIAFFENTENDNYEYNSRVCMESSKKPVLAPIYIAETNTNYNVSWFNGAITDYAEFIYKADDGRTEKFKFDTKDMDILYCKSPFENSYTLDVIYYDSEGNTYQ